MLGEQTWNFLEKKKIFIRLKSLEWKRSTFHNFLDPRRSLNSLAWAWIRGQQRANLNSLLLLWDVQRHASLFWWVETHTLNPAQKWESWENEKFHLSNPCPCSIWWWSRFVISDIFFPFSVPSSGNRRFRFDVARAACHMTQVSSRSLWCSSTMSFISSSVHRCITRNEISSFFPLFSQDRPNAAS